MAQDARARGNLQGAGVATAEAYTDRPSRRAGGDPAGPQNRRFAQQQATTMNLPRVRLSAGNEEIDVYVASNQEERSMGLMFRKEMPPDEGMLFLCDEPAVQKFWMKDTPLPLSIAFIDEDGTISKIDDMEPETLDSHSSGKPVRYVLEVNQGWFASKGIRPGMRLVGPVFIAAATAQDRS
jgi:uncharacterized membrane protein (UPF0127 family)